MHWANGGAAGAQIFAHDIGVVGWDGNGWSGLLPGGSKMKNEDYCIWNKAVRAVADGVVDEWFDTLADNTITADANGNLQFPSPAVLPRAGNSITVRHGTEIVIYCHLRAGSMPAELQQKGVVVAEGQFLGRVGTRATARIRTRTSSAGAHRTMRCGRFRSAAPP